MLWLAGERGRLRLARRRPVRLQRLMATQRLPGRQPQPQVTLHQLPVPLILPQPQATLHQLQIKMRLRERRLERLPRLLARLPQPLEVMLQQPVVAHAALAMPQSYPCLAAPPPPALPAG